MKGHCLLKFHMGYREAVVCSLMSTPEFALSMPCGWHGHGIYFWGLHEVQSSAAHGRRFYFVCPAAQHAWPWTPIFSAGDVLPHATLCGKTKVSRALSGWGLIPALDQPSVAVSNILFVSFKSALGMHASFGDYVKMPFSR